MGYFGLEDVLLSFILLSLYTIILYLVIKQSIRVINFGRATVYIKEKVYNKHSKLFIVMYSVLGILYLFSTIREGKLDVYYAIQYDYYDMTKYRLFLKWALSLLPIFMDLSRILCKV